VVQKGGGYKVFLRKNDARRGVRSALLLFAEGERGGGRGGKEGPRISSARGGGFGLKVL